MTLIAAIKYIGVAGLNPMTAYARLAMCPGWLYIYFLIYYIYNLKFRLECIFLRCCRYYYICMCV